KHLSIKQENIDLYYKNKPRIFATVPRKHLFFDFKFKAKYLAFISCMLEKPDLSVKTALKSIFRKSQVRSISEKFGLNLNAQIVCLSPSQWVNCFLEMLEVVPEKFHPS
ncbi:rRNA adenine N-6-methyltransferase family protein, partial [Bacteroides uniformis]|uniref:rRNA adenine N-6-methyltransferase family protein n=1 Tax=Bacteroides uniformis TaxID=820 RepID=UPI001E49FC41